MAGSAIARRRIIAGCWLVLALVLAACETSAAPTPFPAERPATPTPTAAPTPNPTVRYALDANTAGYVDDIALLRSAADVQMLESAADPADLGERWDIIAAYGRAVGWNASPITAQVALIIRPDALPDDLAGDILRHIDAERIVAELPFEGADASGAAGDSRALRERMANSGWPDGVGLVMGAANVPGVAAVQTALESLNVMTRAESIAPEALGAALAAGEIDAALIVWRGDDEAAIWRGLFGESAVRELYTLPIRYLADESIRLRYTAGGWPLPD